MDFFAAAAYFAPVVLGFPDNGRTTLDGIHYVYGEKLEDSQFRNDPVNPMRESNLVKILAVQTRRPVTNVSWREYAEGRRLRGLLGIACHIVHRGGHLVHGGGDLLGLFFLAADFDIRLLGHAGQRLGRAGQLLNPSLQPANHVAQATAHLLHRLHQLAHLVLSAHLHAPTEIPCGNLPGHGNHAA